MTLSNTAKTSYSRALPSRTWSQRWRSVRIPTYLFAAFGLILAIIAYFQSTYVAGTELNSLTWEIRDFAFRRDPFTSAQLTGVTHTAERSYGVWTGGPAAGSASLDTSIKIHLKPAGLLSPRWDLVSLKAASDSTGRAMVLVELLGALDRNYKNHWSTWSSDNPSKAAVFWPAVQDLVQLGLYAKLPPLFELTLVEHPNDSKSEKFSELLAAYVQAALLEHCLRLLANEQPRDAGQAAEIGLTYGENAELRAVLNR